MERAPHGAQRLAGWRGGCDGLAGEIVSAAEGTCGRGSHLVRRFAFRDPLQRSAPMRSKTYRDESGFRNFDLVGGGADHPWSVDLVLEAVSCFLVGGFAFALVAVWMH